MRYALLYAFWAVIMMGCGTGERSERLASELDIQGHRGARGLLPENSIRGFIRAVDLGVTTLEMDLCITKDRKVIVSHEPYISNEICLDPNRSMISPDSARSLNIYNMTYDEVSQYDCGSLMHSRFPSQGKVKVIKPLLSDVFSRVEGYLDEQKLGAVSYNIELKSSPDYDDLYHPSPKEFSDMVYEEISGKVDWSRVTIQSFDPRILQYFHSAYPDVTLSLLIENDRSWQDNVEDLGFTPAVYSCYYELLTPEIIGQLHEAGIRVIPWTINELEDMQQLVDWGVDGIITDYPDRAQELKS